MNKKHKLEKGGYLQTKMDAEVSPEGFKGDFIGFSNVLSLKWVCEYNVNTMDLYYCALH